MDLYSGAGHIIKEMEPEITQKVTMVDSSGKHPHSTSTFLTPGSAEKTLYRDADIEYDSEPDHLPYQCGSLVAIVPVDRVLLRDHEILPFEENSQDCIMSSMGMHWVNDLPGTYLPFAPRCN